MIKGVSYNGLTRRWAVFSAVSICSILSAPFVIIVVALFRACIQVFIFENAIDYLVCDFYAVCLCRRKLKKIIRNKPNNGIREKKSLDKCLYVRQVVCFCYLHCEWFWAMCSVVIACLSFHHHSITSVWNDCFVFILCVPILFCRFHVLCVRILWLWQTDKQQTHTLDPILAHICIFTISVQKNDLPKQRRCN